MKLSEMIKRLETLKAKHGNVEVMFFADRDGTYSANRVDFKVAEEGDYPKDWMMDAGFEFVEITD